MFDYPYIAVLFLLSLIRKNYKTYQNTSFKCQKKFLSPSIVVKNMLHNTATKVFKKLFVQ